MEGFVGRRLRGVLVPRLQPDGEIQVVSVEVYDDGLIVRWIDRSRSREDSSGSDASVLLIGNSARGRLSVQDDVGTAYESLAFGGRGTMDVMRHDTAFTPPRPAMRRSS